MKIEEKQFKQFLEDTGIHPIVLLVFIAKELGWNIAIPDNEEYVNGLAMGTEEYLDTIFPED